MSIKQYLLAFWVVFVAMKAQSQDSSNNKFGKGIKVLAKDSSFYLKASFRFQTLYNGELNLTNKQWTDNIMIRRARVKFDGFAYHPNVVYKVELAVSNRDNGKVAPENNEAASIVLDAVLKYKFAKGWQLWVGQTKLPGNRERVISSQKLQFVDRSQVNSKFTIDRGTGLQLHHKHRIGQAIIREALAVSMGEGRNFTKPNIGGYEFTSRVELLPFGEFAKKGDYFGSDLAREPSPKLSVGVTYDQNNNTNRTQGFKGKFLSQHRDQRTLFIDAMFKYKGFSTMIEYANKTTDKSPIITKISEGKTIKEVYITGSGLTLQAGYLLKNNLEIAGRYTSILPENNNWSGGEYSETTLGVSKYIVGHSLKVQADFTYIDHLTKDDIFRTRVQVELAF